jgi:hypothetical protein
VFQIFNYLQRVFVAVAGAHAHNRINGTNKDFAVADFAGACRRRNRVHHFIDLRIFDNDLRF